MLPRTFKWVAFVLIMVAMAVLYSRFADLSIDFSQYSHGDLNPFAIFAGLFMLATLLRAIRFGFLTRQYIPIKYSHFIGNFPWLFLIGAMTPFRSGESARALWVKTYQGSASQAIGTLISERLMDLILIILFALLGTILAPIVIDEGLVRPLSWLVGGLGLLFFIGIWIIKSGKLRSKKLGALLLEGLKIVKSPKDFIVFIILTLAIWTVTLFGFYLVLKDFIGLSNVGAAMLCIAAVNITRLFSPSPGNIGTYQAAMIAALAAYNIEFSEALHVGILLNATMLAVIILQGLVSWILTSFSNLGQPTDGF